MLGHDCLLVQRLPLKAVHRLERQFQTVDGSRALVAHPRRRWTAWTLFHAGGMLKAEPLCVIGQKTSSSGVNTTQDW